MRSWYGDSRGVWFWVCEVGPSAVVLAGASVAFAMRSLLLWGCEWCSGWGPVVGVQTPPAGAGYSAQGYSSDSGTSYASTIAARATCVGTRR
ncbi:hypothetical protein SANTM175S_01206 [Streptomyces antimycoticus]